MLEPEPDALLRNGVFMPIKLGHEPPHTTYRKNNNLEKCAGMGLNGFHIRYSAPRTIEKMKILGAV